MAEIPAKTSGKASTTSEERPSEYDEASSSKSVVCDSTSSVPNKHSKASSLKDDLDASTSPSKFDQCDSTSPEPSRHGKVSPKFDSDEHVSSSNSDQRENTSESNQHQEASSSKPDFMERFKKLHQKRVSYQMCNYVVFRSVIIFFLAAECQKTSLFNVDTQIKFPYLVKKLL